MDKFFNAKAQKGNKNILFGLTFASLLTPWRFRVIF